ncbi:MAG: translocated intimin receptor Tir [Acidobacteria bacterium]|nr:translocated intimin receptor Tir [Acidobacteriota bacterium]
MKRPVLEAMLSDVHLWVPVAVLIFGASLLLVMR